MAYGWSVALGALHALLMALTALWLFFVVTFPWENQESPGSDDWLVVVALAMLGAAAVFLLGLMTGYAWLVVPSYVLGAIVAAPALRYALVEWSDHADGKLAALAIVIGASGLVAAVLSVRAARTSRGAW